MEDTANSGRISVFEEYLEIRVREREREREKERKKGTHSRKLYFLRVSCAVCFSCSSSSSSLSLSFHLAPSSASKFQHSSELYYDHRVEKRFLLSTSSSSSSAFACFPFKLVGTNPPRKNLAPIPRKKVKPGEG